MSYTPKEHVSATRSRHREEITMPTTGNHAPHNQKAGPTEGRAQQSCRGGVTASRNPNGCLQRLIHYGKKVVYTVVPPGGILSGAFNMASASIGAGILGLPSATDSCGMVLAIIFLLIITYLSVFSMYILALAAQSTRIRSFEGMARWLFPYGNYAFSYWAAFIRWFHAFAGCVAYVISVGNCFKPIFNGALEKNPDNSAIQYLASTSGNRVLTVCVWFCIMVPLVIPKHIDSLRYASAFAVTFMVYFVIIVVIHSCTNGLAENSKHVVLSGNSKDDSSLSANSVFLFRTGNSVIYTVGVFTFAYVCQINAYEVFWDFSPELRTTRNYTWSAIIAMILCGTLYTLVCIFGYFDFGSAKLMGKSLLLMYDPVSEPAVMVAYVGVFLKLCVAYALLTIAQRNSIYYLIGFQEKYQKPRVKSSDVVASTEMAPPEKKRPLSTSSDAVLDEEPLAAEDSPDGKAAVQSARMEKITMDEVDEEGLDNTAEDTTFIDNIPFWRHVIVVLVLSVASLLCGLFIPNINTVFGFAGAISGGFLAFVFPALFFMYAGNFSLKQVGWFTYINTYVLLICGVVGIVFGTGGTIYDTI